LSRSFLCSASILSLSTGCGGKSLAAVAAADSTRASSWRCVGARWRGRVGSGRARVGRNKETGGGGGGGERGRGLACRQYASRQAPRRRAVRLNSTCSRPQGDAPRCSPTPFHPSTTSFCRPRMPRKRDQGGCSIKPAHTLTLPLLSPSHALAKGAKAHRLARRP